MANELRNMFFAFLLFALFSVLVVTAIYEIGFNYGVSNEKMNEATQGALNIDDIKEKLDGGSTDAENYRERFESGNVDDIDDAGGVFSVIADMTSLIILPFTLLAKVGENLLGFPPVATYTILTIINLLIIFGGWAVLRKGD
jgi:hypothetical protein